MMSQASGSTSHELFIRRTPLYGRRLLLVPRVFALERVDCMSNLSVSGFNLNIKPQDDIFSVCVLSFAVFSSVTDLLWALRRFSFGAPLPSLVSTYISRLLSQLSLQIHRGPLRGWGPLGVALTLTIVRYATGCVAIAVAVVAIVVVAIVVVVAVAVSVFAFVPPDVVPVVTFQAIY